MLLKPQAICLEGLSIRPDLQQVESVPLVCVRNMCVRQQARAALPDRPITLQGKGDEYLVVWKRRQQHMANTKQTGQAHQNQKA